MAIDMHAHWVPRGLLRAFNRDDTWFGWRMLIDEVGREHIMFDGSARQFPVLGATLTDPAARTAKRRREEGIEAEALIIAAPFWNHHLAGESGARFCREVNEELAEVQRTYPDRFRGLAVLPLQVRKAALVELEHAIGTLGLTAITVASNVDGRNLDDPEIMPILEEAARAGVAICVHPALWYARDHPRFAQYSFTNSFGAPIEASLAAMSLVYGGLIDRNPEARIMITQGGGWIHFGVGRLRLRYRLQPDAAPMRNPPEEYLERMYFDCLVHDDDALALLLKRAGSKRVVVGTDYPLGGDIEGGAVTWIRSRQFLSQADREAILCGNALEFLDLDSTTVMLSRRRENSQVPN